MHLQMYRLTSSKYYLNIIKQNPKKIRPELIQQSYCFKIFWIIDIRITSLILSKKIYHTFTKKKISYSDIIKIKPN